MQACGHGLYRIAGAGKLEAASLFPFRLDADFAHERVMVKWKLISVCRWPLSAPFTTPSSVRIRRGNALWILSSKLQQSCLQPGLPTNNRARLTRGRGCHRNPTPRWQPRAFHCFTETVKCSNSLFLNISVRNTGSHFLADALLYKSLNRNRFKETIIQQI